MDLSAAIEQIQKTYNERKDDIQTEEATKMALTLINSWITHLKKSLSVAIL
jgi:hypothetical protein